MARRPVVSLLFAAATVLGAAVPGEPRGPSSRPPSGPVHAQPAGGRITIEVELYRDLLTVNAPKDAPPSASLLDADAQLLSTYFLLTDVQGLSTFTLADPDNADEAVQGNLPGQIVEVRVGSRVERYSLPAIEAAIDPAAGVIVGRTDWPGGVEIELFEPGDFETPHALAADTDDAGRFRAAVPAAAAAGPGSHGTVWSTDGAGNRVGYPFGAPLALVACEAEKAALNPLKFARPAMATTPPMCSVVLVASLGHTVDLIAYEGAVERWRVERDPREDDVVGVWPTTALPGTDLLEAVDRLVFLIDGALVGGGATRPPWARFDPEPGTLVGRAAPDRPVTIDPVPPSGELFRTRAGPDGTFRVAGLPDIVDVLDLEPDVPLPEVTSWLDANVGVRWEAPIAREHVALSGNIVLATLLGDRGPAVGRLFAGDGRPAAVHRPSAQVGRPTWFHFTTPDGAPRPIRAGDRVEITPPGGQPVTFDVPRLAIREVGSGGQLELVAPPGGLLTLLQTWPASYFLAPYSLANEQDLARPHAGLDVADGPDGRRSARCTQRCDEVAFALTYRAPFVSVAAGRPAYSLTYVPRPWVGAAPSVGLLRGFASSGAAVTASLLGPDGSVLAERRTMAAPASWSNLPPRWEVNWTDAFPDGLPSGTRFRIRTDDRVDTLVLPTVAITADVLADTVSGSAPPGTVVEVWALPNTAIDPDREVTSATTTAAPDGAWSVLLRTCVYTLKAGDAIGINFLPDSEHHFFQYDIGFVDGPFEPREPATPTAPATRAATARPFPTGTPPPSAPPPGATGAPADGPRRRIWLPVVVRAERAGGGAASVLDRRGRGATLPPSTAYGRAPTAQGPPRGRSHDPG
ncbi:MAG: hypothetical protein ABI780_09145 [Ardenticatenales bacterium]